MSTIKPFAPCSCRWLDGSYVTNKLNPGDIDILLHIDFEAERNSMNIYSTMLSRRKPFLVTHLFTRFIRNQM